MDGGGGCAVRMTHTSLREVCVNSSGRVQVRDGHERITVCLWWTYKNEPRI